ncbi:MAG: hypothetical protein PQJ35_00685 [Sphaerochaetaceae bacterium]|nr:hypothetical protein [Sphaerochaetaceae bacterium]
MILVSLGWFQKPLTNVSLSPAGVLPVKHFFLLKLVKIEKNVLPVYRRHSMNDLSNRIIAMEVAKGILSESPDYSPESMADFTLDVMTLAESLQTWSENGDDVPVMNFFVMHEVSKHIKV